MRSSFIRAAGFALLVGLFTIAGRAAAAQTPARIHSSVASQFLPATQIPVEVPSLARVHSPVLLPSPAGVPSQDTVQNPVPPPSPLDGYLRHGLDSNLALKQRNFDLRQAQLDLKRARTLFYPQANFNAQYTLASGGRTQDIPIGDLLNDVYSTLNQLTASQKFPQVSNQTINFLPNDFHDTKVEVTMPLLDMDIRYNRKIKEDMIATRKADVDIYKRDLVKNIRQAYYQFLQAGKSVEIYTYALDLVRENLRVSEKMVQNDKATFESVLRAKTQISQVEASLTEATNNQKNAQAYFNFLLNRPLNAIVNTDSSLFDKTNATPGTAENTGAQREELAKLESLQKVLQSGLQQSRSYRIPKLNAFYQVGFQGFQYRFNSDQFYQLGGLQLTLPLFRAGDNKYKVQQAQLQIDALDQQYKEVQQQLSLQEQTALNNYHSSQQTLQAVRAEVQSARETYRLTERRFREGLALQLELVDARTQLTNAQIRFSLAQLSVLTKAAEWERATASYRF